MEISSSYASGTSQIQYEQVRAKPQKPSEPTTPVGGNIENRQPPAEPSPPGNGTRGSVLNITV